MSFPVKSAAEIALLAEKYYQHLSDLIMETLASYSWSREKLATHFKFTNLGVLQPYLEQKKTDGGRFSSFWQFRNRCHTHPVTIKSARVCHLQAFGQPKTGAMDV